jgi:hypothetical protein
MAKRKVNETEPMIPRNYVVGQAVYGVRSPTAHKGVFVRAYVTLNNGWRNAAYIVKCNVDGKERSFQVLRSADSAKTFPSYLTVK